jgi:hypothetical protein
VTAPFSVLMTYSVGDYVWCRVGRRRYLAQIRSAQPLRSGRGEAWIVRVRTKLCWGAPIHLAVECALSPSEVAHNRKLGLLPELGGSL